MSVYEGFNLLLFFIGSGSLIAILFAKIYNVFHKAEKFSLQAVVLMAVASFLAFGVTIISNLLAMNTVIASFFGLVALLFIVTVLILIVELFLIVAGIPGAHSRRQSLARRGQSAVAGVIIGAFCLFVIVLAAVFIYGGEDDLLIESDDVNPNYDIIPYTHNGSNAVWDFRTDGGNYEFDITNF